MEQTFIAIQYVAAKLDDVEHRLIVDPDGRVRSWDTAKKFYVRRQIPGYVQAAALELAKAIHKMASENTADSYGGD